MATFWSTFCHRYEKPFKQLYFQFDFLFCFFLVNATNELEPPKELNLPPNETSVTLDNLKYSTRYKFYLNAMTVMGPGPIVIEEAVTVMDEGEDQLCDLP